MYKLLLLVSYNNLNYDFLIKSYMSRVITALTDLGRGFYDIFSTDQVLYGLYIIFFFWAIFAIYNTLLQMAKPIKGRAATVVSAMITLITVGAIFYGKSVEEALSLFNSTVILIFILIASGALGFGLVKMIQKTENKAIKLILGSFMAFLLTSMLVNFNAQGVATGGPFIDVFGDTGAAAVFIDIFYYFNLGGLFGFIIGIIMYVFSLLGSLAPGKTSEKKKEKDDIQLIRDLLKNIATTINETNNIFKNKLDLLNTLAGTEKVNTRLGSAISGLKNGASATVNGISSLGGAAYNSAKNTFGSRTNTTQSRIEPHMGTIGETDFYENSSGSELNEGNK